MQAEAWQSQGQPVLCRLPGSSSISLSSGEQADATPEPSGFSFGFARVVYRQGFELGLDPGVFQSQQDLHMKFLHMKAPSGCSKLSFLLTPSWNGGVWSFRVQVGSISFCSLLSLWDARAWLGIASTHMKGLACRIFTEAWLSLVLLQDIYACCVA